MLVDATDLTFWANRRDAQDMLPRLVRRLVHGTVERILRAGFRAGEGVQIAGWDGIVEVEKGNAFVPDGTSVWEMGVDKGVKPKADEDYEKRTAEPLGVTPSQSTFVFVTPRRWSAKHEWETIRRQEGNWHDVRAYDADDLEQWLETAPAVHIWVSILLGKHPQAAQDLATYWDNWSGATNPVMSPDLVLAGREDVTAQIHAWLDNPGSPFALRGESRAEAIAVFAAALEKLVPERRESILSRVVLVQDVTSWNHLTASNGQLALVAGFDCDSVAIGRAVRNNHSVIVPLGHSDAASSHAVEIPRPSREDVGKILVANGVAEDKARDLAVLARRSLTAFRRRIAIVQEIEQPAWSRPENARALLPALLMGRWSSGIEGDQQVLATLAGKGYDEVHAELVRWSNADDPPVRCIGTTWYLTSEEDAWVLLGRYLTVDDLCKFQKLAVGVLSQPDPAFDLPDEKRWMAGVIGERPQHSGLLRTGIANTLAILGARGHAIRITGGSTLETYAQGPVRELLRSNDWRVWASLPLGLLAEAAPDEFLDAVDRGASGDHPFLLALFRDKEADMFSSAPHTGLLFALEALGWSEDLLARVATALARLARIDPGGRWANRPLASLRSIFLLWLPQTTAPLERRLRAIDAIRERQPDIAWKVMKSLLPQQMDHSSPTARPGWREWAPPGDVRVTMAEHVEGVQKVVDCMLADVGTNGPQWSDLIEALPELPPDQYNAAVTKLESLDPQELTEDSLEAVSNALRALVSQHRSFADAEWSLPVEEINRLAANLPRFQPQEPLRRYGWLFGTNPSLPEGREDDWEAYQQAIAARQCEAIESLYGQSGLTWLSDFVEHVERPDQLGAAMARTRIADDVADRLLREHLRPTVQRQCALIADFVGTRVRSAGLEWAEEKLAAIGSEWAPAERATFCICLPFNSRTWEIVDGFDDVTIAEYWKKVSPFYVDGNEVEPVARRLLEHGRAGVATDLLQHHVRGSRLSVNLVVDVLERLATGPVHETEVRRLSAHDVADLLAYCSASDEIDESRLAKLEWAFLPALGRRIHTPKVLLREMARNPEFFAQVIALVYRAEGEAPSDPSEEEKARAERAYKLLQSWRGRPVPGMAEDGVFDPQALRDWVLEARKILQVEGRLAMGDHTMGEILSSLPAGDDGAWPHPAVRDLIEQLASDDFEQGLVIGTLNSEGVSWRNPNEGGSRERGQADRYEQWARAISDRWGRTAAMLRRLRDHYRSRADDEDQRAKLRADLSR